MKDGEDFNIANNQEFLDTILDAEIGNKQDYLFTTIEITLLMNAMHCVLLMSNVISSCEVIALKR